METINRRLFLKTGAVTAAVTSACLCTLNNCATITKVGNTPAAKADSISMKDGILSIDLTKETTLSGVGGEDCIFYPVTDIKELAQNWFHSWPPLQNAIFRE